ncbi:hypothetical protein LMG33818_000048 [Halomonadaceae bacterium LMG 33818]|uniref:phage neck terminator protein n=1 Tax=Cernens ardua TaxID=3402176 RepID=UPI003EDC47A8
MIEHHPSLKMINPQIGNSLTLSDMYTALRSVLLNIFDCPVLQGGENRVALPVGNSVIMNSLLFEEFSTNRVYYEESDGVGQEIHERTTVWQVQVDCYGKDAEIMAQTISTLIRSDKGCEWFRETGYDITPLYASTPRQTNFIDSESQYGGRYSVDLHLNPVIRIAVPQSFFNSVDLKAISTDAYQNELSEKPQ